MQEPECFSHLFSLFGIAYFPPAVFPLRHLHLMPLIVVYGGHDVTAQVNPQTQICPPF